MKKVLILLMFLILSGCGNSVHENIREKMAEDTEQVIDLFETAIEEDRDFIDRDVTMLSSYQEKYQSIKDNPEAAVSDGGLTEEENRLFILTTNMIDMRDSLTLLSSDVESFESTRDMIRDVIKTGEI